VGVGLDGEGNPWVSNRSGNAMRIHKTTGEVLRTPQQNNGLYTYSDFTGYQLRNFTVKRGTFVKDFQGCPTGGVPEWRTVVWDATAPAGTAVKVYVKVGPNQASLVNTATQRFGPFTTSPTDLKAAGVPKEPWLRVEFELTSADGKGTPVLRSFNVNWACGTEIN
jgi:hypothetical protein